MLSFSQPFRIVEYALLTHTLPFVFRVCRSTVCNQRIVLFACRPRGRCLLGSHYRRRRAVKAFSAGHTFRKVDLAAYHRSALPVPALVFSLKKRGLLHPQPRARARPLSDAPESAPGVLAGLAQDMRDLLEDLSAVLSLGAGVPHVVEAGGRLCGPELPPAASRGPQSNRRQGARGLGVTDVRHRQQHTNNSAVRRHLSGLCGVHFSAVPRAKLLLSGDISLASAVGTLAPCPGPSCCCQEASLLPQRRAQGQTAAV